jgi:hypothetical protein
VKLTSAALTKQLIRKQFPKRCACGRVYSLQRWFELPHPQRWELDWGEVQELRNCVCRSTMAIVVVPEP